MRQHVDHGLLQADAGQVQGRKAALDGFNVAVHFGRFAQQHVHGHIDRGRCFRVRRTISKYQLTLLSGHAHHRKRAAFAFAQGGEQRQRFGGDGQHVAFLAFVAPDFFGREAAFFQGHGAQVKAGAAARVVGQLGEGVGQAASAHVVDCQNRVAHATRAAVLAQDPALVDHLLRAALHFGVAALHRVKVQVGSVGPGGHRACRAAAHANAHARPTELNQQAARRKFNLVGLGSVNHPQAAGNHDGLVVAAMHRVRAAGHTLLVFPKIAQQIGPPKLVVKGRPTQGPFDHDLQGAGDVLGLAVANGGQANGGQIPIFRIFTFGVINWNLTPINCGDGKAGQAGLGLGAAPGGAFVANFTARAGGRAGEGRNGGRVVVGFDLHQDVLRGRRLLVGGRLHALGGGAG